MRLATMRANMLPIGLVILGVLLTQSGIEPAVAQTPKRGGTLSFAVVAELPNYDCHANTSFAFVHPVAPHYSTLLAGVACEAGAQLFSDRDKE